MREAILVLMTGLVSMATLWSGFGLGSLLVPLFAVTLPIPLAIALAAIVHSANNLLKALLLLRQADLRTSLLFGIPAAAAALLGALVLQHLNELPALFRYSIGHTELSVTPIEMSMGLLILIFAGVESDREANGIHQGSQDARPASRRWLPVWGVSSGFLGGLSGYQGALRAAALLPMGLTKEQYVATSAVCALLVDLSRLLVYGLTISFAPISIYGYATTFLILLLVSAWTGTVVGRITLLKIPAQAVRAMAMAFMAIAGLALCLGVPSLWREF